jgi:hyperosmotically inducible periplasmic protein
MKTQIAASLMIGALILPVAVYAQSAVSNAAAEVKESVTDTVITGKIKSQFRKDKLVRARSVKVDTDSKGVVTLSGNARSQAEVDQAVRIATKTKGVTSVNNNISVGGLKKTMAGRVKEGVGDTIISGKIKAEFAKDADVSVRNVRVDTDDKGLVTLSGSAKSQAEVDRAMRIARDTKGVTAVRNDIRIQ